MKSLITITQFFSVIAVGCMVTFIAHGSQTEQTGYRIGCVEGKNSLSGADQLLIGAAHIGRSFADEKGETADGYRCYLRFLDTNTAQCFSPLRASSSAQKARFSTPGLNKGTMCYFFSGVDPQVLNMLSAKKDGTLTRITEVPNAKIFRSWNNVRDYLDKGTIAGEKTPSQ